MSRAGCWAPFAVTTVSWAGGASALVAESSFSRTPEMILTVAVACATAGGGRPVEGVEAAIAAAATNQIIA